MTPLAPKRLLRSVLARTVEYLERSDRQHDERYQTSQIFARTSLGDTVLEGENLVCEDCMFRGDINVGRGTTFGPRCILNGKVTIGRYCQLAAAVALYAVDHPLGHLTTYVSKPLFEGELRRFSREEEIHIGSDVWIGHGAVVLKGVSIGDGAAVGAGSIVTRSVPSYAIVAGNPARVLRLRFDEQLIESLQRLKWWNLLPEQLSSVRELFLEDIAADKTRALELLEAAAQRLGQPRRQTVGSANHSTGRELRYAVRQKRA